MNKSVLIAALGLSTIASSLAASTPASAFQLYNFANHNMYLGVAAGTPTKGTKFITWTHDSPRSLNQTFSVDPFNDTWGSPASSLYVGREFVMYDGVAVSACVDIAAKTAADGTNAVVGYFPRTDGSNGQWWIVDSGVVQYDNSTPCFRFKNKTNTNEVLSVLGGNPQKNSTVGTYHTFSDYWYHLDQFWCVVD